MKTLKLFAMMVDDINRGLELATRARFENVSLLPDEQQRLLLKCHTLLSEDPALTATVAAARGIVQHHRMSWCERMRMEMGFVSM